MYWGVKGHSRRFHDERVRVFGVPALGRVLKELVPPIARFREQLFDAIS